jgi:D-erythronate 2-dehydrogenase
VVDVVITGGAGFLGSRLARTLLADGWLDVAGGGAQPVARVTLFDQAPAPADLTADERVAAITGDLNGPGVRDALASADVVFHLGAAVSAECEADFDLGMRSNLLGTLKLLADCRELASFPLVVYSSSLAAFGGSAELPLPAVVDDDTPPNPQTSYGAQKVIGEQLLADYTRKEFLRGRAVRLPTVSVRPGRPNGAATGFLSGIIREPLAGQRVTCPVEPPTAVALISPDRAVAGLLRAATASDEQWADRRAVNLPALTVTVAQMVAALERASPGASALIDWAVDLVIEAMVMNWPARINSDRAARLGLTPDPDMDSIVASHRAGQNAARVTR